MRNARRRLREHGRHEQQHYLSRRRERRAPLSRLSDRGARSAVRFHRDQLPADLRRVAQPAAARRLPQLVASAHDAARGHEGLLQRFSARCPSDGHSQLGGGRLVDLLPGLARPAQCRASRGLDLSPDGQAADHRGFQLQEVSRAAVHLSAQRSELLPELFADDVRRAQRALSSSIPTSSRRSTCC